VKHVGKRHFQEQTTYDDRLAGFSEALFFKYKTCANCVNGHRLLDMANTKHNMKADCNALQNSVELQSMSAYLPPVRTYSKNSERWFRRSALSATTSGETFPTAFHKV